MGEGCGAKMAYLVSIMRSVILTILLLVVGRAAAQNDTIFPNGSGGWADFSGYWEWTDYYVDGIGGPWNVTQYAMYRAEPSFEQDGLSWGTIYQEPNAGTTYIPQGRIAVDSGRVYFRPIVENALGRYFTDTLSRLLYDFNLQVGDTAYSGGYPGVEVVLSIDTVYLSDRPRRRFNLTDGEQWIAGMGSTRGLMWQFTGDCECGPSALHTFCGWYMDADSVQYDICTDNPFDIQELQRPRPQVHPNPSTGTFVIDHAAPNKTYQLTDARGIVILVGKTTTESTTIQVPNAVPGLYVLDVDGTRTKVIVQ